MTPRLLIGFLAAAASAQTLTGVRVLSPRAAQYEKIEIALAAQPSGNPFDPNEVRLDARITLPSGKTAVVPGFWFQDYSRSLANPEAQGLDRIEILAAKGQPEWRVRFSSPETGRHSAALELRDKAGLRRSAPVHFEVTAGARPGFVRVSPRNPEFLEFDNGRPFFPLGQNLCMYQNKEGTYYFDRLLGRLVAGGGNYARIWQEYYVTPKLEVSGPGDAGFTGFPLETQVTGLGRYDLESAWRLDYVAELCERTDVWWQLTFEMVVWWEKKLPKWKRNPYNAANGGPCADPIDYLTDPKARDLVKRRLRYSVARWGWTPNLAAWELWNEVDNIDNFDSRKCAAWHREMGAYLKEVDPWKHPVATSWRDRATFALSEIDIAQGHSYFNYEYDAAEYSWQDTEHLMRGFGKPFFFGEQGLGGPVSVDPEGKHFHDCLWATTVSGAAGAGMYWWWHNYIEPYNLYHHYGALKKFVEGIDFPARRWKPVRLSRPSIPVSIRVYGIAAPDRALIWIHDPLRGGALKGVSANFAGLDDGAYEIEWRDTSSGGVIRRDRGTVRRLRHFGYGLELKPPEFRGDIAARVSRSEGEK